MEEDIKILSHFLDGYKTVDIKGNETGEYWSGERYVKGFVYKAIENILNRLEQDERVIEEMAEYISGLDTDEDICKKRTEDCYADMYIENACKECVIDHFRKKCE